MSVAMGATESGELRRSGTWQRALFMPLPWSLVDAVGTLFATDVPTLTDLSLADGKLVHMLLRSWNEPQRKHGFPT